MCKQTTYIVLYTLQVGKSARMDVFTASGGSKFQLVYAAAFEII